MKISKKLLVELQKRLKVGNLGSVYLNAIPGNSNYKFDVSRLGIIDSKTSTDFIEVLLSKSMVDFKFSWAYSKGAVTQEVLSQKDELKIIKTQKVFETLTNQIKAMISETGTNSFGFGYPLLIRRNLSDHKIIAAPLLIWKLSVNKQNGLNSWILKREEDDVISANEVLINYVETDCKIKLPQLNKVCLEKNFLSQSDLIDYCANILHHLNGVTIDEAKAELSNASSIFGEIKDKKYYEKNLTETNKAFIDFSGLFSIFKVQKQNIINDYDQLIEDASDELEIDTQGSSVFQSISSIETDPTQQEVLNALSTSNNLLIQGPPGTGKSQTLTAILVNALSNHKKTLVVCEKRTALEVLQNSLTELGFSRQVVLIKDAEKDRKIVVDTVRDRFDNDKEVFGDKKLSEALANVTIQTQSIIDEINQKHKKLDEILINNSKWTELVGQYLKSAKYVKDQNTTIDSNRFEFTTEEFNRYNIIVAKCETLYSKYIKIKSLAFLNAEKFRGDNEYRLVSSLKDDFDYYKSQYDQILALQDQYKKDYIALRKDELASQFSTINTFLHEFETVLSKVDDKESFYNEQLSNSISFKLGAIFNSSKRNIRSCQSRCNEIYKHLFNFVDSAKDFDSLDFATSLIERKSVVTAFANVINDVKRDFDEKILNEYETLDIFHLSDAKFKTDTLTKIDNLSKELDSKIKNDDWIQFDFDPSRSDLMLQKLDSYNLYINNKLNPFSIEFEWFSFYNELSKDDKLMVDTLVASPKIKDTFWANYFNTLLIHHADHSLPKNDNLLDEYKKSIESFKIAQSKYISKTTLLSQNEGIRNFNANNTILTIPNLYNKRASTRHTRKSLREIVDFDSELFISFFPIILTTPDVASCLFQNKNRYFDIVMFDEASQLRVEDNLPAMLKGKQVIIAGDENQMPPSNFFEKLVEGEDEEYIYENEEQRASATATYSLLDCESLLDLASQLDFEKRFLDFHYRSKHPYLIDFSNAAFYNHRLKPLGEIYDYVPICYVDVKGTYTDQTNNSEAEVVLSIIENNINRYPNGKYPSLGVATFNLKQRNLILSKINDRKGNSQYKAFNDKISELEADGFFVKNLENIQGDERDVIILSTTYGCNEKGKPDRRFGVINQSKGKKLLNVIITRAKYKIYLCSSIPQKSFLDYRNELLTLGENNKVAVFYAYLAYAKAVSDKNEEARNAVLSTLAENPKNKSSIQPSGYSESPFEDEVYDALREFFDKDSIIQQFKCGGYRIDMVYKSPKNGVPLIAIECDGAKYHSSREAYLNDCQRQKVLEQQGFVFHRIWSTNWWQNAERETKNLVDFIHYVESMLSSKKKDMEDLSEVFTDDVKINIRPVQSEFNFGG